MLKILVALVLGVAILLPAAAAFADDEAGREGGPDHLLTTQQVLQVNGARK